jgi:hypothetical protein
MKISMKAVVGFVVLTSVMGTGWLTLPAAPPTSDPGVYSNPKIAPGVSGNPNIAPGVSTNLPYGASATKLPPGVSNKPF